jgi:hypothetical protein
MFRLFLLFPLFFSFSFSWSCAFCKQQNDCPDPDGYGLTEIILRIPLHQTIFENQYDLRVSFSSTGKKEECRASHEKRWECQGDFKYKKGTIERIGQKDEQKIYITSDFFYKDLYLFVQYNDITLFDGIIDFQKEPHTWSWGPSANDCRYCEQRGVAYITSNIVD